MFELRFDTDNAAFEGDDLRPEIARILRKISDEISADYGDILAEDFVIRDINGNEVGFWGYSRCSLRDWEKGKEKE